MKVLKIGAVWCSGCVVMRPIWREIEKEISDLETEYLDFDDNEEELKKYNLGDILPVFIFLDMNGNELERLIGEQKKEKIISLINKYKEE